MADQRSSAFRFRFPWLQSAAARRAAPETQVPSQPTSTTGNKITPSPGQSTSGATPTPTRAPQKTPDTKTLPLSTTNATTTSTAVTPQIQSPTIPTPSETSRNAEIEAPKASIPAKVSVSEKDIIQTTQIQTPSQSTATRTSDRPPFRPPGDAASSPQAAPLTQPQASRTESQPSSSPSRLTTQSRAASQPASPSRATNQSRTSQPSTPSRATSQSRPSSLLSSPSRKGSPNSTTPRTTSQPSSQPRTTSRPAGQTPTTSPSSKMTKGQSPTATLDESKFPSKDETSPSSKPSSSTYEMPDKEPKSIISAQQFEAKEDIKSGITNEFHTQTPVKTKTESNGTASQPFKGSGRETATTFTTRTGTPQRSKKLDTPIRNSEPESSPQEPKPEETKEVKEIMQETEKRANKEVIDTDDYLSMTDTASDVETKEQLSFTSQSEKAQQTLERKEAIPTPASAQLRNKNTSASPRQKLTATNGDRIPLHKDIRGDITKNLQKMAAGDPAQSTNEKPFCVITLAGENKGATMQLGIDSLKKGSAVPIRRGYKIKPDENVESSADGEESFKVRSDDIKEDTEDQTPEAFINSNIQGINNSIMFNGAITERNPGVHLVHSRFPIKFKKSMAETELHGREKTEFSTAHAQRPVYQPIVKRRCLRGLFLESSDSDPENTTKPRHHGCRVGCREKNEKNKINSF